MAGYLLDTNVLIGWFGAGMGHKQLQVLLKNPGNDFFTSVLCVAEFLSGCSAADAQKISHLIENNIIGVIPFEGLAQAEAVAWFRKNLGLKTPDAIVAAAAKQRDLILFTFDKEFKSKAAGEITVFPS